MSSNMVMSIKSSSASQETADPAGEKRHDDRAIANGGLVAWLQVACSWNLFFNTWGILNTFGVYQTYYESKDVLGVSTADVALIGALQAAFLCLGGLVSGAAYDRGYLRHLLLIGTTGIVGGHVLLSFCAKYWQVLLAQGLTIGLGGGLLFIPSVAILPEYFDTRLGSVTGVAASGSSFGGIIYPIMFSRLISVIGFEWAIRVLALTALITLAFPVFLMSSTHRSITPRPLLDYTAMADWPTALFTCGATLGMISFYVGTFYISYFAYSQGLVDASLALYLVPIVNASSLLGRTLPNMLSDRTGPISVMIPGAALLGTVLLCNIIVRNMGGVVVTAIFFGISSGVFVALPPVCLARLSPDKSKIGVSLCLGLMLLPLALHSALPHVRLTESFKTRIGQYYAISTVSTMVGGPGAGAILRRRSESLDWTGVWLLGGISCMAACLCFLCLRIYRR